MKLTTDEMRRLVAALGPAIERAEDLGRTVDAWELKNLRTKLERAIRSS